VDIDLEIERLPSCDVVHVRGVIDLLTAPSLDGALAEFLSRPDSGTLVVDLTEAGFIDSSGLNVLATAAERLIDGRNGAVLRLVVTRPIIREALEVTGLTQVFQLYESVDDAVA
jgi:anti-sigma B factor antagonist